MSGHFLAHFGLARQRYACSKNIYILTSFRAVKSLQFKLHFVYSFYHLFPLKVFDIKLCSIAQKELHSLASFTTVFLKRTVKGWSCVLCASPRPACLFTPALRRSSYLMRTIEVPTCTNTLSFRLSTTLHDTKCIYACCRYH